MNRLRIGNEEYRLPSCWTEVSEQNFRTYAKSRVLCGKDELRLLRTLVYRWSGMPVKTYMSMNLVQTNNVATALDWIFTDPPPSKNMIPEVHIGNDTFYGAGDDLKHVLVKEWMCADPCMKKFMTEQSDESLDKAICFLYRPRGNNLTKSGDPRTAFDEFECLDRLQIVKKMSAWEKLAISVNYMGMRTKLVNDYPHVFKGGGSGRSFGIPGMIHDLAGPELGTVKEIEDKWTIRNLCFIIQKNEIRRLEAIANKTNNA